MEMSSLEGVKALISVDPGCYKSTTCVPSDNIIPRRLRPKERPPRVCVIGAGISGLRCGKKLCDQGFRVTIFEARNRVGGRVSGLRVMANLR